MIVTGSAEHGQSRRRRLKLEDGFEYFKGEWLEAGQDPHLSPTMFLIEQGPHSKLAAHFHRQNEFQVVVEGAGTFGTHAVQAITVHYAGEGGADDGFAGLRPWHRLHGCRDCHSPRSCHQRTFPY